MNIIQEFQETITVMNIIQKSKTSSTEVDHNDNLEHHDKSIEEFTEEKSQR